jgi:tRNA splicing ligase
MSITELAEKLILHRQHLDSTNHLSLYKFSVSSNIMVFVTLVLQVSKDLESQKHRGKMSQFDADLLKELDNFLYFTKQFIISAKSQY